MSSHRASLEVFLSRVRWAAFALSLIEAFIANPPPVSMPAALFATALLGAYNIPATFCGRLSAVWRERVIFGALVGDFVVTTIWLFMSANDPYDPTFSLYSLVAIEAALLYEWRGVWPFISAFLVVYSVEAWDRSFLFRFPFEPDVYLLQTALTSMVAICVGGITQESERRRRAAEHASAQTARQAQLAEALHIISGRIARTLKHDYIVEIVVNSLKELFPNRWHALLLSETEQREVAYVHGEEVKLEFLTPNGPSFAGIEHPIVVGDMHSDERILRHLAGPTDLLFVYRSAALLPLWSHGRLLGLLTALDPAPDAFVEDEVRFLESLAFQTSTALENARLYEDVELMSLTDATTALFNRRAFDLRLEEELVRARRYRLPLALMMLDVDHFKNYNDSYGHLAGDEVLRRLAEVLEGDGLRHVDLPFRFGGEEFAVILPHTTAQEALALGRRLCRTVASEAFPLRAVQPDGRLTISAGVAAFPDHADSGAELVDRADLALYAAKRAGRNRATVYREKLEADRPRVRAS